MCAVVVTEKKGTPTAPIGNGKGKLIVVPGIAMCVAGYGKMAGAV